MLLVLCTAMFLGAFASGYIPLAFGFSEAKLRLITIFGAGLLVGTALIVIIPEGVSMHYEGQQRHAVGAAAVDAHAGHAHGAEEGAEHHSGEGGDDITHAHPGHWQIGASLALGFAFQLIVGALLRGGGGCGAELVGRAPWSRHPPPSPLLCRPPQWRLARPQPRCRACSRSSVVCR